MRTRDKMLTAILESLLSLSRGIILLGIVYVILSPLFSIISESIMTTEDFVSPLVFMIPQNLTLYNFHMAFIHLNYVQTIARTFALSLAVMVLQVIVCSMTGYGFARFRFPFKNLLFGLVIVTIVVPVQAYMVPMFSQFLFFRIFGMEFNLLNTYAPVLLLTATGMGLRAGLFIYIFRQFFRGLPKEIEEAARIDGAGWFRTYAGVMMPNAVPAIITVCVFSFVWQYNDTFYASMFMGQLQLLPMRLTILGSLFMMASRDLQGVSIDVQLVVSAGVILAITPVMLLYFGIQRFFMEGLERSGIVG